jgi:hypothetical protein
LFKPDFSRALAEEDLRVRFRLCSRDLWRVSALKLEQVRAPQLPAAIVGSPIIPSTSGELLSQAQRAPDAAAGARPLKGNAAMRLPFQTKHITAWKLSTSGSRLEMGARMFKRARLRAFT